MALFPTFANNAAGSGGEQLEAGVLTAAFAADDQITGPGSPGVAGANLGATVTIPQPRGSQAGSFGLFWGKYSANCTMTLPTQVTGRMQSFVLRADQPATGGPYTLTFAGTRGTDYDFPGVDLSSTGTSTLDLIPTAANAPTWIECISDGVKWHLFPGTTSASAAATIVQPLGNLVVPVLLDSLTVPGAMNPVVNRIYLARAVIPYSGTLHDVNVYIGTASGNAIGGVYSTASSRVRLWAGSSTPITSGASWTSLGDPALTVTGGQQVELGVMFDNTVATFGRGTFTNAASAQLPSGFLPASGATPKLSATNDAGSFAMPTPIAEGSVNVGTGAIVAMLIARVA